MKKQGTFLGIPYDWSLPTWNLIRERMWNKNDPHIFTPKILGWGYSINFYQLFRKPEGLLVIIAIIVLILFLTSVR